MFISMFRSDIGMKLVSVTWVYGRIPGLSWLFSKLSIPFQRRLLCHTLHPDEKTPQFPYKKNCLHPPHLSTHHPPTLFFGGAQLQRALEIMASMDAEEAFEDHLREGPLWVVHSWRLTAGTCPHGGGWFRSFSFLNWWFVGSMLIFQGVLLMVQKSG